MDNSKDLINFSEEADTAPKTQEVDDSASEAFSVVEGVKHSRRRPKDKQLKTRLQTLIHERKMSEPEFFHSVGLTRQHWYALSWGIFPCPVEMRLKIAAALGVDSVLIWRDDK